MGNKQTRQKKILDSERFHKTDIAFSGAGFLGMYYVGATYCISLSIGTFLRAGNRKQ